MSDGMLNVGSASSKFFGMLSLSGGIYTVGVLPVIVGISRNLSCTSYLLILDFNLVVRNRCTCVVLCPTPVIGMSISCCGSCNRLANADETRLTCDPVSKSAFAVCYFPNASHILITHVDKDIRFDTLG